MLNARTRLVIATAGLVVLVTAAMILFQTPIRGWLYSQAIPTGYFSRYEDIKPALYQVSGPVYAFEAGFNRALILRSNDGIAVIDTFGERFAKAMKAAIERQFPGEVIRWVIFSHNHLDHIRGSTVFAGAEVIGHKDVNQLVSDWKQAAATVAVVTRVISGDETLQLGNLEVRALYLPFSHSQTLYGFHILSADAVFAPDTMFVKMVPPFDFPDFYYPGFVRALDRLIALNAQHYVPSHAHRGTREDFIAFRNMTVDFQTTVRTELLAMGIEAATDGTAMRRALRASYAKLKPKHGDWHGFDDMFIPKFGRHFGGTFLGY